jgi:3-hydroxyisobutyrate dehydrogenase
MAERMIGAGLRPYLWARRPEVLERYAQADAVAATSPAEVGAGSDVIGLCLYDGAAIDQVLFGPEGLMLEIRPHTVVAVHSTVGPNYVEDLADRVAGAGVVIVDAPVSGGPAAARGELLVIAGGDEAALERCGAMFGSYSNRIVRTGGVGSAQAAKLVNNCLMTAITGLVFDAFDLGAALGIDQAGLGEVLSQGSAANPSVGTYLAMGAAQFSLAAWPTLHKDVDLAHHLGAREGLLLDAARATIVEMERRRSPAMG